MRRKLPIRVIAKSQKGMDKNTFSQIAKYYSYPDRKVEYFVPREHLLRRIEECHQWSETTSWASCAVLHGLGGCGKTQLALEYCDRTRRARTFDAIFWIDASSPATIVQCYITIAATIFPNEEPNFDEDECVHSLLDSIEAWSCSWLFVFDNCDGSGCFEYSVFHNFVPQGKRGHLLFTCRDAALIDFGHPIMISQMSENESLELLFSRSQIRRDIMAEAAGLDIVSTLEYSALAIDSAAAYIKTAHIELGLYTFVFEQRRRDLQAKSQDCWDDWNGIHDTYCNRAISTYTSIDLSLSQVSADPEIDKMAIQFLNILAFLGGQDKRMALMYYNGIWNKRYIELLVNRCHDLSLVQYRQQETGQLSLTMHSVVQEWIKRSLRPWDRQRYINEVIGLIYRYIMNEGSKDVNPEGTYAVLNHLWSVLKDERELCPNYYPETVDPILTNFFKQHRLSSTWEVSRRKHDQTASKRFSSS